MEKIYNDKELQNWFLNFCKDNQGCYIMTEDEKYEQDQRIAELEEQLGNVIVPKFKIGQEVWIIRGKENRRIDKCKVYGFVNNQCIRLRTSNRGHITRDLIYTFVTKEEAQAKLEELKG